MDPNNIQQMGGKIAGPQAAQLFSKQHHDVYEKLRGVLMGLHGQGVPGMDNVLQALNKEHVNQTKNMVPGALDAAVGYGKGAAGGLGQAVPSAIGGATGQLPGGGRAMIDHNSMQDQDLLRGIERVIAGVRPGQSITPEMLRILQVLKGNAGGSIPSAIPGTQVPSAQIGGTGVSPLDGGPGTFSAGRVPSGMATTYGG